jgi:alkylation response protein AidB-like acyl-CoA dehydrogenase
MWKILHSKRKKKWTTNGNFADYFVTDVRKGEAGIFVISMLLIERSEGTLFGVIRLTSKLIKSSYSRSAGTVFVTLMNVKLPVDNLLEVENQGFKK